MQEIAIIPIGEAGRTVAARLKSEIQRGDLQQSWRKRRLSLLDRCMVKDCWNDFDAFVFIGAMGICVRTISPLIEDKHNDPAVICIDSFGRHVISVLSGHIGGANDLTRDFSEILKGHAVITTQSDMAGLWALDTLANQFGWRERHSTDMSRCIFSFVNRHPTALFMDIRDEGTDYLESTLPEHVTVIDHLEDAIRMDYALIIIVSPRIHAAMENYKGDWIQFIPRCLSIGFGLAHQASPAAKILREMQAAIADAGYCCEYQSWCSIDVKKDEPVVRSLRRAGIGAQIQFFTAEELASVTVPNPSETVERHVGTPSVCEAAAILGAGDGQLLVEKVKGKDWTLAIAISRSNLRRGHLAVSDKADTCGHIEIVGAGPGDPDLISVRGRRMLEKADLILYAGSLVPKALTECHKPGAVVRSSADMALEEQCEYMKSFYDRGLFIVRLHTGDPCIFGAIQEQMAFFDKHGMNYHITPGISSFLAAAAELRSQFTIPELTQTIILTRGEGRTPMPEKEQLHLLARSRSTMCIFLSAAIVDDVQRELLQEYPEDTPVAACYHLTWPDQKIYRGKLKDLTKIVRDNKLTLTTMLVVGEAIDNRQGFSELYNKHFTHLYRKGEE